MPDDWQVHHTLEQKVRERLARRLGINVDDPRFLRALPENVHNAMSEAQRKWWNDQIGRELSNRKVIDSLEDAIDLVPLKEIKEFYSELLQAYDDVMVTAGDTKEIREKIKRIVAMSPAQRRFAAAGAATKILKAAGIVSSALLAVGGLFTAHKIATSNNRPEFQELVAQYEAALNELKRDRRVSKNRLLHVTAKVDAYLRAIGVSDNTRAIIVTGIYAKIDLQ